MGTMWSCSRDVRAVHLGCLKVYWTIQIEILALFFFSSKFKPSKTKINGPNILLSTLCDTCSAPKIYRFPQVQVPVVL